MVFCRVNENFFRCSCFFSALVILWFLFIFSPFAGLVIFTGFFKARCYLISSPLEVYGNLFIVYGLEVGFPDFLHYHFRLSLLVVRQVRVVTKWWQLILLISESCILFLDVWWFFCMVKENLFRRSCFFNPDSCLVILVNFFSNCCLVTFGEIFSKRVVSWYHLRWKLVYGLEVGFSNMLLYYFWLSLWVLRQVRVVTK